MVAALEDACHDDSRVRAAWLGGSLARGTADDWSDVDLHVLVDDPEAFGASIEQWMATVGTWVLADPIPGVPGGFLFVTPDWIHVDVIVHGSEGFSQSNLPARVLVGDEGLVREVAAADDEMTGDPYLPLDQVKLFLYFLGVTVTVIKREEWVACRQGTALMRDTLLIPLMLAENGVRKTDGAKRLNRYLTTDQIEALDVISPASSAPDDLITSHAAIAREYLTRGRRLAHRVGEAWPEQLEQATVELWKRELDRDVLAAPAAKG